ncbi:MAG: hypothetical protein RIC56_05075 [Pseudomonadales bacterium]
MSNPSNPCWWVPREVPPAHTLACRIGPLMLDVHHGRGEWQLACSRGAEEDASADASLQLREGGLGADGADRFMVADGDPTLTLIPLLADRPVVIRPRQPLFLPRGEEVTLYLSTPVTVCIRVGAAALRLREVASLILSDTWFGPSSREGELCYSGRTHARIDRSELPRRAHRVVTPVRVRNEADTPLPLEKLSLPVQVLSVYGGADGGLWSEPVSLVRDEASDLAQLQVDEGAPDFAGPVTLLSGPREVRARGSLVRAFNVLFGNAP